jgi:nucleoside-diphosphate-sugar epimerase
MITILGASGFIGSNIIKKLTFEGMPFYAPSKTDDLTNRDLGDVIYCIGLTADFRTKPFETVTAHVCKLNEILSKTQFNSLTYLSSSRVYINSNSSIANEDDKILVDPLNSDELYTLTKLTGERLCLSSGKNTRIVRLSNVIGKLDKSENFLSNIINEIKQNGELKLYQSLTSAKDYIHIDDVVELIVKIAVEGNEKIYNIASGMNANNEEILSELKKYFAFNYSIIDDAKEIIFSTISNKKICSEFQYQPKKISEQLSLII